MGRMRKLGGNGSILYLVGVWVTKMYTFVNSH